jgi:hypothetical protein
MLIDVITREDLNEFRNLLLNDLKQLIQPQPQSQPQSEHGKQWLKSSEVRKLLSISPGTLSNLRVNGILTFTKIGGTMYYKYSDIEKVLNGK